MAITVAAITPLCFVKKVKHLGIFRFGSAPPVSVIVLSVVVHSSFCLIALLCSLLFHVLQIYISIIINSLIADVTLVVGMAIVLSHYDLDKLWEMKGINWSGLPIFFGLVTSSYEGIGLVSSLSLSLSSLHCKKIHFDVSKISLFFYHHSSFLLFFKH